LAPECFNTIFGKPSDIWATGITIWEILTFCKKVPYTDEIKCPASEWAVTLKDYVLKGKQLNRPSTVNKKIWKILSKCWILDQDKRINAQDLSDALSDVIINPLKYRTNLTYKPGLSTKQNIRRIKSEEILDSHGSDIGINKDIINKEHKLKIIVLIVLSLLLVGTIVVFVLLHKHGGDEDYKDGGAK